MSDEEMRRKPSAGKQKQASRRQASSRSEQARGQIWIITFCLCELCELCERLFLRIRMAPRVGKGSREIFSGLLAFCELACARRLPADRLACQRLASVAGASLAL